MKILNKRSVIILLIISAVIVFVITKCDKSEQKQLKGIISLIDAEKEVLQKERDSLDLELRKERMYRLAVQDSLKSSQDARDGLSLLLSKVNDKMNDLRDEALKMPSNDVYTWLDKTAYPFMGEKKYLFNDLQIKNIYYTTKNYGLVKEKLALLELDIAECNEQLSWKDSINNSLDKSVNVLTGKNKTSSKEIKLLEQKVTLYQAEKKPVNIVYGGLMFWQNFPTNTSSIGITVNYATERLNGLFGFDPINKGIFVGAGLKIFSW
jgi:hypothetical protein